MRKVNLFKVSLVALACLVSAFLAFAVGALFFVPAWTDIVACLASDEIIYSLTMSLVTGIISTALVMLAAVPIAYSFSRYSFPGQRIVRSVLYLPIAFPEIVLGLSLLLLFGSPIAGRLCGALGIDFVFTKAGIVAAQFFTALPYSVRIIKTVFDEIDPQLELVSRSLGCSQTKSFFSVTLPLAGRGLKAAGAIAFARCVGAFGSVLILAGGTRMNTETLTIALYLNMSYGNLDMAVTAGLLLVIVAFIGIFAIETMEGQPARRTI